MSKETDEEKIIRYLKRRSLDEVRNHYFNTDWTSYTDLKNYFKESGWTRSELVKADRPIGRGEARYEKRILYWYLQGLPDQYETISEEEIKEFEKLIQNNLPTIVVTRHGNYESDILFNPTYKQLLKCVRESIYVNKDPDHCGIGCLPLVEKFVDGGEEGNIEYQIITYSMDS